MAAGNNMELFLNDVLIDNIPIHALIQWLEGCNVETKKYSTWPNSRPDFAFFFLNFLREESIRSFSTKYELFSNTADHSMSKTSITTPSPIKNEHLLIRRSSESPRRNVKQVTSPLQESPHQNSRNSSPGFSDGNESPSKSLGWKSPRNNTERLKVSPSHLTLGNFIVTKTSQKQKKNKIMQPIVTKENHVNSRLDTVEFPEIGTPKRRINPTRVAPKPVESFGVPVQRISPGTNPFSNVTEHNQADFEEERKLLKTERLKQPKSDIQCSSSPETPVKVVEKIDPLMALVTKRHQLDVLAKIYSCILECNLALNLMVELQFLLELLLVESSNNSKNEILGSNHNCVYFAISVLKLLKDLLPFLDYTTLRLLSDNSRIKTFSPELKIFLTNIQNFSSNKSTTSFQSTQFTCVVFQSETDNKQNFSTNQSFQNFRKQRDDFYALIQKWETEKHFTNWMLKVVEHLIKIPAMEPDNFSHFARLFVAQLCISCCGKGASQCDSSAPSDLKVDPQRLRRLQERLVTPVKTLGGPCPAPEFEGWEEFYRDFILIGSSYQFNQHLKVVLINQLTALNSQQFSASDLQDGENRVEEETRHLFLSCVQASQLIAKFLGFIEFLPFRSPAKLSDHIIASQCAIRKHVCSPLDTHGLLCAAESSGRLVLTISWISCYLAQMDAVSAQLQPHQATLARLLHILRNLTAKSSCTNLLLCLTLGWLFDTLAENSSIIWSLARQLSDFQRDVQQSSKGTLDTLDLVDGKVLYALCPFLSNLRLRLAEGCNMRERGSSTTKHITPVAAHDTVALNSSHQLELQLEESFFHGQVASLRKTVDFVAERIASGCVKQISSRVIGAALSKGQKAVKVAVDQFVIDLDGLELSPLALTMAIREGVSGKVRTLAGEHHAHALADSEALVATYCTERCETALKPLLPPETTKTVLQTSAAIASRISQTKARTWLSSHVTSGQFLNDLQEELEKISKSVSRHDLANKHDPKYSNVLPPGGRCVKHNEAAPSPAETLVHLRELILCVMHGVKTDSTEVQSALISLESTIKSRGDMIPAAETMIQVLSLDLAITLAVNQPELLSETVIGELIKLWQGELGRPPSLDRLICIRNIQLMSTAKRPSCSWDAMLRLLTSILTSQMMTAASLEEQAIAVLQQDWPPDVLRHYTSCIDSLVKKVSSSLPSGEGFGLLLDWLSEFCCDLEDLSL